MAIFDKNIKKKEVFNKFLRSKKDISDKERKILNEMARHDVGKPSGISKKEVKKLLDKADKEGKIDHKDAYRIKKYDLK
ncbi:hypothetical protein A3I27_03080 [Candidatus Giovannonibacteria bacterium RIFCSPLOWO2_02_FULL_43_11b]|uniref:Uncharacterized protein n=1 Tax=Candidatus Giovannonibacteria bacterium RIFCSPHIGHO2_12_FULL_43_15 TaxID=1798341 RepID=A0A1F5WP32_9BACT|nr:MAG: hypothetical protein A2739_01320 [Candidatus Giovannonibacteria bacterium RIFCSPHIGHO2_01_FULL_43_100]OGF77416.1 MAG: hypothetical protein A3F23_01585 [Candidatus Giovannonibacteria bacterium RIFCSPHIGHO2_12_FULL_43_15]OGF79033.1 MAG: hypothetical protein A3A15_03215 [Candidatus Giovannonibacteria bacterium RIFCSPLOWO2_01_FULL_43_60]OGF89351.1 MAG: hypothetical protein A3I27_03080 [Candidatus Giovannonibacteria bacterium RIFCSPLOWO2_02_FULL_43_11b]OGF92126.1 MAG: hypothetical protein A3